MAIIKYPECMNDISDKAEVCVHCGYPIIREQLATKAAPALPTEEPATMEKTNPSSMDQKKKITIAAVISIMLALIIVIIAISSHTQKEERFKRDFGEVFAFNFEMDMEDIIMYQALTFGNIDYEYDPEVNRLDFADDGEGHSRHKYFFDDETSKLTSAYYMDQTAGKFRSDDSDTCEHIKPFKNNLIKVIGDWDSDSYEGLFKEAYGNIGGIRCKVTYQDGHEKAIFISRHED